MLQEHYCSKTHKLRELAYLPLHIKSGSVIYFLPVILETRVERTKLKKNERNNKITHVIWCLYNFERELIPLIHKASFFKCLHSSIFQTLTLLYTRFVIFTFMALLKLTKFLWNKNLCVFETPALQVVFYLALDWNVLPLSIS